MCRWLGMAGWLSLTLMWAWTLAFPGETFACSPTTTPFSSAEPTPGPIDYALAADVVIEGEVIDVDDRGTALVEVEFYYKGHGPAIVTITGFGVGEDCRDEVSIGTNAVFYGMGNPNEQLSALHLRTWHATDPITEQIIREVTETTGQGPLPPVEAADTLMEPVSAPASSYTDHNRLTLRVTIVGALSFILLLLLLSVRYAMRE
jgi:hypothetical protein